MAFVPPFLHALELDADADERAIRRAYAKRLKRIDPETDPEAFQALRENFEAALEWVKQPGGARVVRMAAAEPAPAPRAARAPVAPPPSPASGAAARIDMASAGAFTWAVDDAKSGPVDATPAAPVPLPVPVHTPRPAAPAPVPAAPVPAAPVPARVESAPAPAAPRPAPARPLAVAPQDDPAPRVFADFADRFTRTASNEVDTARLLREALADERLLGLEARTQFEGSVVALLAGGWQPGHEHLFKPACDVFEWETDRRRLEIFGPDGVVLDAAVRERLIFFAQPAVAFEAQKALIRRLRKDRPAITPAFAAEMKLLSTLTQRFPNWMRVMTRREIVQHWIEAWNALPDAPETPSSAPAARPAARAATPTRQAAPSTRAPQRGASRPTAPMPPAPPVVVGQRSSFGGFGGFGGSSVGTRWVIALVVAGVLRMFGSLGHASHPAPPPPAPPVAIEFAPSQGQPTAADSIRALAGQGQQRAAPGYSAQPTDPIEAARQQGATARRQAEMDQRYQEILETRHPKKAVRRAAQGEQTIPLPDPN